MFVVGLTGGIGSGKTTVANLFKELNVPIIDADIIAREITTPDHFAFDTIINHFGKTILTKDGTLDRQKLRKIIFNAPHERKWLENLLHPLIRQEIEKKVSCLYGPYCIAVIPLLLETTPYTFINRILVVDTPEHLQISRIVARDQVDQIGASAILKTQAAREARRAAADDLIINDGKVDDLHDQVKSLHQLYLKIASGL